MSEFHGKVWGYEHWITNNEKYCGKILHLWKGYRCSYHYHKVKHETFYILKGKILMAVNSKERVMEEGDVVVIAPGDRHSFTGLKNSEILEISTQHFEDDSYRITKSCRVGEDIAFEKTE